MPAFLDFFLRPFAPQPPYRDAEGAKGRFTRFAQPLPEDWTEPVIALPGWQGPALKIALLTDLHAGSHTGDVARFHRIVARASAWGPDLALFGGDYINTQPWGGGRIPPEMTAGILSNLAAPLGRFAVIGNHDWGHGFDLVAGAFRAAGTAVLENAGQRLDHGGQAVWLAGVSDEKEGAPDMAAALAHRPEGVPAIVLAHDPYSFRHLPAGPNLMLSGHTHGGQFCLPGGRALVNASRAPLCWTKGHVTEGGRQLYVSRGLGTSFLPIRTWCPPEVTLLTVTGP